MCPNKQVWWEKAHSGIQQWSVREIQARNPNITKRRWKLTEWLKKKKIRKHWKKSFPILRAFDLRPPLGLDSSCPVTLFLSSLLVSTFRSSKLQRYSLIKVAAKLSTLLISRWQNIFKKSRRATMSWVSV